MDPIKYGEQVFDSFEKAEAWARQMYEDRREKDLMIFTDLTGKPALSVWLDQDDNFQSDKF